MKGRKLGLKSTVWTSKEEINIQSEQNEETRIQKNEERLRNIQDNFKMFQHLNHRGARRRRGRARN